MFPLTRSLSLAAAGAVLALAAPSIPARADELAQNLGPVGPHEPILTTVGSQRVIAFYVPGSDRCALHAVVWDNTDADAADTSAARVRVSLQPGQIVHIDTAEQESLNLQCGKNAEKLAVVDTDSLVAFGITTQQSDQSMKANASGFLGAK
ncbi:MAG TPA: hypothetical protein VIH25_06330 [Steroidobacteraceae bacterium]|jgi:hypothetical protein